jgi:nucleotide-binding universal stress UspA family protein
MKVIIATDGTDTAIAAAQRAVGLLHPDAHIALVTVVAARPEPMEDAGGFAGPLISEEEADEEWHEATAAGREALVRTLEALESADVNIDEARLVPSQDSADRALVALVAEERPDLLVLGSNERGWFDRMLHGATDDRLLHEAPCPLMIVGHDVA